MALEIVLGVIIILAAVVLTAAVLLQSSKNDRLSGVIAGGADTFFGKSKGKDADKKLNRLTIILAVFFAVIILVMFAFQIGTGRTRYDNDALDDPNAKTTTVTTTTDPESEDEEPDTTEAPDAGATSEPDAE